MTTLGTNDDRVARLEGLLKRVQVNAASLRRERAGSEVIAVSSPSQPGSEPSSGAPVTAPTGTIPPRPALGTLPDFLAQAEVAPAPVANFGQVGPDTGVFDAGEPATQVFPPVVTQEPGVPDLDSAVQEPHFALDSLDADLPTLPPSRDDDFEDPSAEHTKPLWLGLDNDTGTLHRGGGNTDRPGDSHRTLAETPAAKVSDTLGVSTDEAAAAPEPVVDLSAQRPSEVAEDGSLDIAAFDRGFGEEEYLDTNPPISGHRPSSRDLELTVEHELGAEELEQELEVSPTHLDDPESRISDAPPSVIGATITLPEDSSAVALELLEPPPSATSRSQPSPRDELEAELPRTSFRAEYDASLSAPPSALEDLRAHDRAEHERKLAEGRASVAAERVSIAPLSEDDLPPVLSSRPASPSGQVNALLYKPEPGAVPVVYEGTRPALRGLTFLELLDASLAITPR